MAKTLQDFNFQGNPYMAMINGQGGQPQAGAQAGGQEMDPQMMAQLMGSIGGGAPAMGQEGAMPSPQAQAPQMPAQGGMPQAGMPAQAAAEGEGMAEEGMEEDQLQKGVNPTKSKYLVKVIDNLEGFITDSTDKEDIMFARGLLSAVSRLLNKDQEALRMQISAPTPPQANPLQ